MTIWEAILLGIVQGLAEFLPISSSGHLVLAQHALGLELTADATFEVMLHLGTALSIITVYWRRVGTITKEFVAGLRRLKPSYRESRNVRTGWHIVIAMLPLVVVYVLAGDALEASFASPRVTCVMLLVTGLLLWLTVFARRDTREFTAWKALGVGAAQAIALLPGMSRSGATICTGLYLRIRPAAAADFSFLMVLPAILGGTLLKGSALLGASEPVALWPLAFGTFVAYVSGIAAIRVVLRVVRRGQLHYFAYYCLAAGALGLLLV